MKFSAPVSGKMHCEAPFSLRFVTFRMSFSMILCSCFCVLVSCFLAFLFSCNRRRDSLRARLLRAASTNVGEEGFFFLWGCHGIAYSTVFVGLPRSLAADIQ